MAYTRAQIEKMRQDGVTSAFTLRPDGLYDISQDTNALNMTPSEMGADANRMINSLSPQNGTPSIDAFKRQIMASVPSQPITPAVLPSQPQMALPPEEGKLEQPPQDLVKNYLKEKYFQEGLDDSALQEAQDIRGQRNFASNIGKSLSTIAGGIAGIKPDQSFYDNLSKQANLPVEDVLTRRKAAIEDLTTRGKESDLIRDAALRDPNSPQSVSVKNMVRRLYPEIPEEDIKGLTAADEKLIFQPLQLREQMETRRQNAKLLVEGRRQEKQEKQEAKLKEEEAKLSVPGFERGAIKASEKEVRDIRDSIGIRDNLNKSIDRLSQLIEQHGSYDFVGPESAEMQGIATDIQLKLKDLNTLGALTGPDLMILQKQITDPQSLRAIFTRPDTARQQLETLKNQINQKVDTAAQARGYKPLGGSNAPQQEKILNGVRYRKVPGGWEAID